ncbi:MAG: hypothetical protein IT179_12200 [Acidobacteria bacterium]|nr:hypothetical protein [Acidobacteriota bacterium]
MGALSELPPALLAGWALWLAGGLALMLWFRHRSARPAPPPAGHGVPPTGTMRLSGTRPAPARSGVRRPPDAFAELQSLLDQHEDRNR